MQLPLYMYLRDSYANVVYIKRMFSFDVKTSNEKTPFTEKTVRSKDYRNLL